MVLSSSERIWRSASALLFVDRESTRSSFHAAIRVHELLNPSPVVSPPLERAVLYFTVQKFSISH